MQVLRQNWPFKLAGLAGAIILSVYVNKQVETLHRTISLPVAVPPRPGARVAEPSPGFQVIVDLDGPAEMVRRIDAAEVKLIFDPSNVPPGKLVQVPVAVELPERYQRRGVDITWHPRSVPVQYISDALRTVDVIPKPLQPLEGWRIKEVNAVPARVSVSGQPAAVLQVDRVVAPFPVEAGDVINTPGVALRALDHDDNDITNQVVLDPPQGLVTGLQERVRLTKRVPVQPVFSVPAGRRVSVEVQPPRVSVTGPDRAVGAIYVVETELITLAPGQAQLVREVPLTKPRGDITLTPATARVTLRLLPAGR